VDEVLAPLHRAVTRLRHEGRRVCAWSPTGSADDSHAGRFETYKIDVVDGPKGGNTYTVRLSMTGMPKEELARLVKQLQDEKSVRLIGPKPTE